jgi:tRNA nucleotidyltransferase/poly(A) polymerase
MESLVVNVKDKEELFILSSLQAIFKFHHDCGPLFIVGGWVRAKLTSSECFDFEILCRWKDFEIIKKTVVELFSSLESQSLFPECKVMKAKAKKSKSDNCTNIVLRLSNVENKKYKITLRKLEGDDLRTDAVGRDFTFNATYCDLRTKIWFDPQNGVEDYRNGILKTIGSPEVIFSNDFNLLFRWPGWNKCGLKVLNIKT